VFDVFSPHPFHAGAVEAFVTTPLVAAHIARGGGLASRGVANDLPVTNSAIARRSSIDRPVAIEIMGPVSSAASTR
jgi:hypothetical protein